jgi:hypothetical protein
VTGISGVAATAHGTIVSNAGADVTAASFTWNTRGYWETGDPSVAASGLSGQVTGALTNLTPGAHYYVLFQATNSVGTGSSEWVEFIALAAPIVTTQAVTGIEFTEALGHGTITNTGGATVTNAGVVWATHTITPANQDWDGYFTTTDLVGAFNVAMSELPSGTHIYVRARAANSVGYGYGNEVDFWTAGGGEYEIGGGDGDFPGPSSWGSVIGG